SGRRSVDDRDLGGRGHRPTLPKRGRVDAERVLPGRQGAEVDRALRSGRRGARPVRPEPSADAGNTHTKLRISRINIEDPDAPNIDSYSAWRSLDLAGGSSTGAVRCSSTHHGRNGGE